MGAAVGRPDKPIFVIDGDGSFQMNVQEMMTLVEYGLPVKIAIMNNQYLGWSVNGRSLFWKRRYSGVDIQVQPDFVKLAEAYGAIGLRCDSPEDVEATSGSRWNTRTCRSSWTSISSAKRTSSR